MGSSRSEEPAIGSGFFIPGVGIRLRDWMAWNDRLPGSPSSFHVHGEVLLPNRGVEVLLATRAADPFSTTLLLELALFQKAGNWSHMLTWSAVRHDRWVKSRLFERVEIVCQDEHLATLSVDDLS